MLELGGHAPFLVLPDADIEAAARLAVAAKFRNAGQVCTSPTRFYVHASVLAPFTAAVLAHTAAIVVGPGDDVRTTMGPLATARHLIRTHHLVEDAVAKGARVLAGGRALVNESDGYFYAPTLLADVPDSALLATDEPFAPIAIIAGYDSSLTDVIARANRHEAALAGYVFGKDAAALDKVAAELDVGVLGVNTTSLSALEVPFGGFKQSGYGKEGGEAGLHEFLISTSEHRQQWA